MVLTLRQWSDYKSSLWAAAVPGLLLSLSNTSSVGSLLASSLQSSFYCPFWCSTLVSALCLASHNRPSPNPGNKRRKQQQVVIHLAVGAQSDMP